MCKLCRSNALVVLVLSIVNVVVVGGGCSRDGGVAVEAVVGDFGGVESKDSQISAREKGSGPRGPRGPSLPSARPPPPHAAQIEAAARPLQLPLLFPPQAILNHPQPLPPPLSPSPNQSKPGSISAAKANEQTQTERSTHMYTISHFLTLTKREKKL